MFDLKVPSIGSIESSKANFFDREKVHRAVDRSWRRVLNHFGGYVRKVDRNSQKKSKGVSAPGAPPFAHLGFVKNKTDYAIDPATKSVVIGPWGSGRYSDTFVALETGGTFKRMFKGHRVQADYRARPHTKPAFNVALQKLAAELKDFVHK